MQTLLVILILSTILYIIISITVWSIRNGISPMPTSRKAKKMIVKMIHDIDYTQILELGTGWGGLAVALASAYPKNTVHGYETSHIPFLISKLRSLRYRNLHIYRKDFLLENINNSSLIVCYLYPGGMSQLKSKLEKEHPKNIWIISHTFAIREWTPLKVLNVNDLYHSPIYVYHFPHCLSIEKK